jgi:hypothetical protein
VGWTGFRWPEGDDAADDDDNDGDDDDNDGDDDEEAKGGGRVGLKAMRGGGGDGGA